MPKILLSFPDVEDSVMRPVVLDVTRRLFEFTGIPKDTRIQFNGYTERAVQAGATIGEDNSGKARLPFESQVTVEVEEEFLEEAQLTTPVFRNENAFIFGDPYIGVFMRPVYAPSELTINFRFRARDRQMASTWRNEIRARVAMMRDEHIFSATYHYLLPVTCFPILKHIHELREKVEPYGESWDEYFKKHRSDRVHLVTNLAGKQDAWAFAETQSRIVGWFDFQGAPEKGSKEDEADTWTIDFSYKFRYEKPTNLAFEYPLVVHNQLISKKFRPTTQDFNEIYQASYRSLSSSNYSYFEAQGTNWAVGHTQGFVVPAYNDFKPNVTLPALRRVYDVMLAQDPKTPLFLFNLNEVGDLKFDDDVLELMKKEAQYIKKPYETVFTLSIYMQGKLMSPDSFRIDKDLNVYLTSEVSYRNRLDARLSILTNYSKLKKEALDRLKEEAEALLKCIDAVNPEISAAGLLPDIIGGNYLKGSDLKDIADYQNNKELNENGLSQYAGDNDVMGQYRFNTVQTLFIEVHNADSGN